MKRGFTLVELMTTIVIIGILSTIGVYGYDSAMKRGRDNQRKTALATIQSGLEKFYLDNRKYPFVEGGTSKVFLMAEWQIGNWDSNYYGGCTRAYNLNNQLIPKYISSIPSDPKYKLDQNFTGSSCVLPPQTTGIYMYIPKPVPESFTVASIPGTKPTGYYLLAKMENGGNVNINSLGDIKNRANNQAIPNDIALNSGINIPTTHNYYIENKTNE